MSFRITTKLFSLRAPLSRSLQNKAALRPCPPPRVLVNPVLGSIAEPADFFKAIGRGTQTKISVETWRMLFELQRDQLKKAGLGVKDRKYVLWGLEKYRQGEDPADFAHPPTPKKKIRGRGPAVQNGKRIRSRRHR
ncbi:hypothetical protein A0H81_08403, partial [Grifola frondosa]